MAASSYSFVLRQVRNLLREPKPRFWQDDELVDWLILGAQDLWGELLDIYQDHFFTLDVTNVSLAANATSLTGVPTDCFRIIQIAPRDLSSTSSSSGLVFLPRDFTSNDFQSALAQDAADPGSTGVIYFCLAGVGSPISAPVIYTAPKISSALLLSVAYAPTLAALNAESNNPIPSESNNALICWTVAWAKAKESADGMPDAGWLAMYATAKERLRVRSDPRQQQEPDIVEGLFDGSF